ncbi:MAG: 4Fe-4S binding protein [Sedimentisphaerales bacterium]|nr:4Fe-4S binding protein [Sedimentisphaerales bacterium]
MWRIIIAFVLTIMVVVSASVVSIRLWAGKKEQLPEDISVIIDNDMTLAQFGQKYNLRRPTLKEIFNLTSQADLNKSVLDFGMNRQQISKKVNQVLTLQAEHASKNWIKIVLKGGLWIVFLIVVFFLFRKGKINTSNRKWIYAAAVIIFGIILGSDPSPMGTVKDALVLFGSKRLIFPPRLIAFFVFLLMVVLANKFICSWGCQLGTLQDLIFRFNRDSRDRNGLFGQVKIPFIISNSVRIIFFLALTIAAFLWAFDIVEPVDPFKIFKPQAISIVGGIFLGLILVASLFVYRPWCHFFCPFGLVGWLAEKISIFKIKVDYDKCISCQACSKACPSTVMDAILKRDKVVPDCFSCGNCIETCPAAAISFSSGKRQKPPQDKFAE